MTKRFVSDLVPASAIDELFLLAEPAMAHKKDGNPFLNVTLSDRTGQVKGVVWDQVARIVLTRSELWPTLPASDHDLLFGLGGWHGELFRWLSLDGLYVRGIKPAHLSFVGGLPALRSLSLRNAGKLIITDCGEGRSIGIETTD